MPQTAAEFFDTLSDKEIRRRQDLCDRQIALAHAHRNTLGLERLRVMETDLTETMLRRCP